MPYQNLLALLARARADLVEAEGVAQELTRDGCLGGECRNMAAVVSYLAAVEKQVNRRAMDCRQAIPK